MFLVGREECDQLNENRELHILVDLQVAQGYSQNAGETT